MQSRYRLNLQIEGTPSQPMMSILEGLLPVVQVELCRLPSDIRSSVTERGPILAVELQSSAKFLGAKGQYP